MMEEKNRVRIVFILAGAAIFLRMASDWIFPLGGPLTYQIIRASLLLLAIIFIRQLWNLFFYVAAVYSLLSK